MPDSFKYTMHDVAKAFLAECRKYPDGHVLRSIGKVEARVHRNTLDYVSGVSVGKNNDDTKVLNFTLDNDKIEEYVTDEKIRFDHVQLCAEQLYKCWSGDNQGWGCAGARQF